MTEQQEKEITDQYLRRNLHDMLGLINDALAQAESRVREQLRGEIAGMRNKYAFSNNLRQAEFNQTLDDILALLSSKQTD